MKISLNWLRDYIDYKGNASELEKILTNAGLEVEGIEKVGAGLEQVIIAKVQETSQHPDADKLKVCKVFDGKEVLQIVCGAPNVRAGLTVAFSPIGCQLPDPNNPNGSFKIKKSKIRGVESFGMICAEDELGLGTDHDGIMELDESLQAGQPFMQSMGLPAEILEISITPNRPDCLSYIGVAREVAAATGLSVKIPDNTSKKSLFKSEEISTVQIADNDCPRYIGLAIKNVKIGPSPVWLKKKLEENGLRSINNVVDITNFVMLETGNPLHAFDARDINGKKITVRKAKTGEIIKTLDEQDRKLLEADLVICDESGPVALAGVMGGANSEIKDDTTDIFIEAAYFSPPTIRKTARRLGLQTDSSYRFERGVDPNNLEFVASRTASLMQQLAGGEIADNMIDIYPQKIQPASVTLRPTRVNSLLGKELNPAEYVDKLKAIGFELNKNAENYTVKIPTYRPDVTREVDMIEEIARLVNFDAFPYSTPKMNIRPIEQKPIVKFTRKTKEVFSALGFNETISFHFTGLKDITNLKLLSDDPRSNPVQIKNPIVEDFSHMQTSMVPNLLRSANRNINHFEEDLQIFEIGRIFLRPENKDQFAKIFANGLFKTHEFVKNDDDRIVERAQVAGLIMGNQTDKQWNSPAKPHDFYSVKGLIEKSLSSLKISSIEFIPVRGIDTYLHQGKSASIKIGNDVIGSFGEILPQVAKAYDLKGSVFVFEFDLASIMYNATQSYSFRPISKYPVVYRDLSFAFEKTITWQSLEKGIANLKLKNFKGSYLFDQFTGGTLSENQHSLAIKLAFQSDEKTLQDEDTQKAMNKTIELLTNEFKGTQR